MLLGQAIRDFETQLRANQRSPHTISSYLRDLGEFRAWLATERVPTDVRRLSSSTLCRFATARCATETADGRRKRQASVDKIKMSLRAFFRFLLDAGELSTNPARVLKFRRDHRVPELLTDEERDRLRQALDRTSGWRGTRDAAILALLLGTGIRLSSLVALDAADVHFAERVVLLRRLKGGGEVRKGLSEAVRQRLTAWLAARALLGSTSPALLVSTQRRRLCRRQVQAIIGRRLREAGIARRVTAHGLRHTFATALYRKTKDILLVQRALDHRSIASTLVYARVADEQVAAAVAGM
ncbi:MAG: tyrosine-type recombinase/integrase [Planctomycetia bacterium]|nr:tyrosine-type recombinase/integrase [Planctomycetia bacterium]